MAIGVAFMFEGHDTTSAAVAWSLFLVATHPDVQAKLHEELDRVVGNSDEITTENVGELKYLEMVNKASASRTRCEREQRHS